MTQGRVNSKAQSRITDSCAGFVASSSRAADALLVAVGIYFTPSLVVLHSTVSLRWVSADTGLPAVTGASENGAQAKRAAAGIANGLISLLLVAGYQLAVTNDFRTLNSIIGVLSVNRDQRSLLDFGRGPKGGVVGKCEFYATGRKTSPARCIHLLTGMATQCYIEPGKHG